MSIQIKKQLEKLLLGVVTAGLLFFVGSGHAVEQITYYHNDALGSPVAATDNTGTLLWREAYEPYGERLDKEAPASDTVWFTGKQEESLFGISYFGARWYDPEIGRFMGIDSAGFNEDNIHSFNKYAYANNNPYKYLDPDGNSPLDIGFFIADSIKLAVAIYSGNAASIQTAAADLAASTVGLVSPVPFTGQAIKAAKAGRQAAKIIGSSKGGDNLVTVFRGVKPSHPGFKNAQNGIAKPRSPFFGHSDPARHNAGNTKSKFVSVTTDRNVARRFSGRDGVIIESKVPQFRLTLSPDKFNESERLIRGRFKGVPTKP